MKGLEIDRSHNPGVIVSSECEGDEQHGNQLEWTWPIYVPLPPSLT